MWPFCFSLQENCMFQPLFYCWDNCVLTLCNSPVFLWLHIWKKWSYFRSFFLFSPLFLSPSSICIKRFILMAQAFSLMLEFLHRIMCTHANNKLASHRAWKQCFCSKKREIKCVFTGWSFKRRYRSIRCGTWNYWTTTYCFVLQSVFLC